MTCKFVVKNLNMDVQNFDPDQYLETVLKESTLKQIMDTEASVLKETQTLHSDMQTLVYENYNKFISATDTIRKMKTDFNQMEADMNLLKTKMSSITKFSEQITDTLQGTQTQLCKLSEKHSLLQRLQFLSSLPAKLKTLIDGENYAQTVQEYLHAQNVFKQYGNQPSFRGIQKDCETIIDNLKSKLRNDFRQVGDSAKSLTETGELLLQLDENPKDLSKDMLTFASKRLHEQIIILQDQTERDMIEFIDLGIEGFLSDLTIVITSYHNMFLNKNLESTRDDFCETSAEKLNDFTYQNIQKYLTLVQDRVESEIGYCDTEIIIRGLDRLHRRLSAMRNVCSGIEIKKSAMDIIINAALTLCAVHSKTLKDHFSDTLSSVRLSLVSLKNDESILDLNELIKNLYISTVEKVKSVLQDLLIFLQSKWSFNLKGDYKEAFCVKGIREFLLIDFLRHMFKIMVSFTDLASSSPPNLLLVLSKTCIEMEQNGVHMLILSCLKLKKTPGITLKALITPQGIAAEPKLASLYYLRSLISVVDDLYEIDSGNSAILTHETEISTEMRESAQFLLDTYVRLQGVGISQMMRRSVETRDWIHCLEPRNVRAVMKRVVEELSNIEVLISGLYENGDITTGSSDSSRKTHFSTLISSKPQHRSNWSNCTPSQLESTYTTHIHKLFSEKIEIFSSVEFTKVSIMTGIIKIGLKTLLECVRLRTFSKFGLQQIQVDTHYLQMNLWRFVTDENLINFILDEILGSAVHRCLESILMEPNAVEIICERA